MHIGNFGMEPTVKGNSVLLEHSIKQINQILHDHLGVKNTRYFHTIELNTKNNLV